LTLPQIEAEKVGDVSEKYEIEAVPSTLFLKVNLSKMTFETSPSLTFFSFQRSKEWKRCG